MNQERKSLAADSNSFALDLYAAVKKTTGDNLFFSPFSISASLAMTYAGARGNTATQIEQTLHLSLGQKRLHTVCGDMCGELHADENGKNSGYQLNIANRLFVQESYALLPEFMKLTQDKYAARAQPLDFVDAAESARKTINDWVASRTNGKVEGLIPPGAIDSSTRLVLTNAIYFKGDWVLAFKKEDTTNATFSSPRKSVTVPMMNQSGKFGYYEEENLQILDLPYQADTLTMTILLPTAADGLARLENELTAPTLRTRLDALVTQSAAVSLPKFKLRWAKNLIEPLQQLGMSDAFNLKSADFSGITADPLGLYITAVFHQAALVVNEEGTEAAAATAGVMAVRGLPPRPKVFRADRPFLFLIREKATGTILFMGRVLDPKGE